MRRIALSFILLLIVLTAIISSTYAWFIQNTSVSTSTIKATIGDENVKILIGNSPDDLSDQEFELINLNESKELYPVSTADLKTFIKMAGAGSTKTSFEIVDEDYFHAKLYLKAVSEYDKTVSLYLNDNMFSASGDILNAGRLGFLIDGEPYIFETSDLNNEVQTDNTYIGGVLVKGVLIYENDKFSYKDFTPLSLDNSVIKDTYPEFHFDIDTNKLYEIDIFFYLEGTDPDCNEYVELEDVEMHISLTGVIS
ncbi:MAG: hypothetical protein PUC68_03600 [Firmicutes bacterium]|nr:hypothetical protein [Bacillota bacterium]